MTTIPLANDNVTQIIQALRIKLSLLPEGHEAIAPLRLRLADLLFSRRDCRLALDECQCLLSQSAPWLNQVQALIRGHLSNYKKRRDIKSLLFLRSFICTEMQDIFAECC